LRNTIGYPKTVANFSNIATDSWLWLTNSILILIVWVHM